MKLLVCLWLLVICSILFGASLGDPFKAAPAVHRLGTKKPISVLLVPLTDPSHWIRISAIGDALVRRGHNVTLCTTEREGSDLPRQLADRVGMTHLSAGPDPLPTVNDYIEYHTAQHNGSAFRGLDSVVLYKIPEAARRIADKLQSYTSSWDIIIADQLHSMTFACLSIKWGVPLITFRTALDYANMPQWPFPSYGSAFTDDLSFLQRIAVMFSNVWMKAFVWYGKSLLMGSDCSEHYHQVYYATEGYSPEIVANAIGFEYPRSLLPSIHYVGPLIIQSEEALPPDLLQWLALKPNASVIYISMGSGASLTKEMATALVHGILPTNHSVVWSLRKSNQDVLEGMTLNRDTFYISSWLPQQTVLRNKAIGMAILHGGMGGVTEALSNAIPLIVIPFIIDQHDNAARVQHAGAGVYLDCKSLSPEKIQRAVETVTTPRYKMAAEKLQKIFLQAGGAKKAADLVEFYAEVGYDHLIPAYMKYKWSWVQYYNVDVYAFFSILAISLALAASKLMSCYGAYQAHWKNKVE